MTEMRSVNETPLRMWMTSNPGMLPFLTSGVSLSEALNQIRRQHINVKPSCCILLRHGTSSAGTHRDSAQDADSIRLAVERR